jgi:hypothetical protein
MTGVADQQGAAGRRPRWLTLFAVLLLLLGGRFFVTGLSDLHRLATGTTEVLPLDGSLDVQQELLLRAQVMLGNALRQDRPAAMTFHALARMGLGLLYLFAVAALFSGDKRGQRASLWAGWTGLAVSAWNLFFLMLVVRGVLPRLEPALAEAFAKDAAQAGRPPLDVGAAAEQSRLFLLDVPMFITGIGVLWSLLLIAYFRSRSVRLFYNQIRADHD